MSRESEDLQEIFRIAAESSRLGAEQGKDTIAKLENQIGRLRTALRLVLLDCTHSEQVDGGRYAMIRAATQHLVFQTLRETDQNGT